MLATRYRTTCALLTFFAIGFFSAQVPLIGQATQPSGVQAPPSEGSEDTEGADADLHSFRVHVRELFNQGSYSELDNIAARVQNERLRFRGGFWQIHIFYVMISNPGSLTATDAEWQANIASLEKWSKDYPDSPVPRIALGQLYGRFAWKARGNGVAKTVTSDGWDLFNQRIQRARQILDDSAKMSVNCPEWYQGMQLVARAQSWPQKQVDALVEQAFNHEPGYYYFATEHANYLLPKWGGKPGETEQYAEQISDRTGGDEGNIEYFMIAAFINCCRRTQAPGFSWTRVKQGFAALDRQFGTTNQQRNVMAWLALRAGDKETAQQMFARIGNDWNESVWRAKSLFDASRTGQPVGGVQPLKPDTAASK